MRTRAVLTVLSTAAIAASTTFLACGNGDDSTGPAPKPAADASTDGSLSDGSSLDAGATGDAKAADAGDGGETAAELKHVYVIMMENHAQKQIIGDTTDAPNLNALAQKYGTATNYYGVTHPSLPNYLAAVSGDFQGIFDDCNAGPDLTCPVEEFVLNSGDGTENQLMTAAQAANAATIPHWFTGRTIVDQLEEHGLTWEAYMGSLPATGDVSTGFPATVPVPPADAGDEAGTDVGNLYAQKHNPFMYFPSIRTNANRMQRIVPITELASDLAKPTAPNFVWISPDQCADMHGIHADTAAFIDAGFCGTAAAGNDMDPNVIKYGDAYVGGLVKTIMATPSWSEGSAIVIVFDEDDYVGTSGCCNSPTGVDGGTLGGALVPAIVISSLVAAATTSADPYNHYSLLATLQHIWGLDCLANTCGMTGSSLMTKLFVP
ncbi:MAG TPA: alkaline phosphatase family protein [Polyangiaceae bacterium]